MDVVHKVHIEIEDKKLVTNVPDKLDLVNSVNIKILGGIRTKKDHSKMPLKFWSKVFLKNMKYFRKAPRLRQTEEYHSSYISPDLTNEQQRNGKFLRDELKLRTNNREEKLWIQGVEGCAEKERMFSVNIYRQSSLVLDSNHVNNLNETLCNENSFNETLHNVNSLNETLLNESKIQHGLKCIYTNARSIMNRLISLEHTTKQLTRTYNTSYSTSRTYHTQSSPEM